MAPHPQSPQRRAGAVPGPGLRRIRPGSAPGKRGRRSGELSTQHASATLARRMATRKEEKERLRTARLEAERREAQGARKRLLLGYAVAGVLTAAVLAGIVVVVLSGGGGGGPNEPAAAHIDTSTGSVNGVAPDAREGTTPPPVGNLDLTTAAANANCDLRLNLRDEGNTHVQPGTHVTYHINPPTSGNHVAFPFQQADGAYSQEPALIDFVHSLE